MPRTSIDFGPTFQSFCPATSNSRGGATIPPSYPPHLWLECKTAGDWIQRSGAVEDQLEQSVGVSQNIETMIAETKASASKAPPFREIQIPDDRPSVGAKEASQKLSGLVEGMTERGAKEGSSSNIPSLASLSLNGSSSLSTSQLSPASSSHRNRLVTQSPKTYNANGQPFSLDTDTSGRRLSSLSPKIDKSELLNLDSHQDKWSSGQRDQEEKEEGTTTHEHNGGDKLEQIVENSVTILSSGYPSEITSSYSDEKEESPPPPPQDADTFTIASTIATDLTGVAESTGVELPPPPPPPSIISPSMSSRHDRLGNHFFRSKRNSLDPPTLPGRKSSEHSQGARQILGLEPSVLAADLDDQDIRRREAASTSMIKMERWDSNSSGNLDKLPCRNPQQPHRRTQRASTGGIKLGSANLAREMLGLSPSIREGRGARASLDDDEIEIPIKTPGSASRLSGRWENMSDHSLDALPRRSRRRPSPKRRSGDNSRF